MNEQSSIMNQQQLMHMNQIHQPPQMLPMNRNYGGMWAPQFQNPNPNNPNVGSMKPPVSNFVNSLGPRNNWKGKRTNNNNINKSVDKRRIDQLTIGGTNVANSSYSGYQPPLLNELQQQNRLKARKFFPKKKFNNNKNNNAVMNMGGNVGYFKGNRSAPFAPRNTSSFLIRAKKSGGIAPLVSPCPVTPAVLPTPNFSPSKEVLVDMAKEEWGVDGYGSMKGLIRLRSEAVEDDEEDEGGSSESDVEERVEVERRLDHDLSRFEMICDPSNVGGGGGMEYNNVLENRVDDQDSRIAQLEEENLIMKERLFLMEREFGDLRRRMQSLGRRNRVVEFNEEVVENESENDSESREEARSIEENARDFSEDNNQGEGYVCSKRKEIVGESEEGLETTVATGKYGILETEGKTENDDNSLVVADKNCNVVDVVREEENNNFKIENNNESAPKENTIENVAVVEDLDGKGKAVANADVESPDLVMLEGDVRVEEVEPASDSIAPASRSHTEM